MGLRGDGGLFSRILLGTYSCFVSVSVRACVYVYLCICVCVYLRRVMCGYTLGFLTKRVEDIVQGIEREREIKGGEGERDRAGDTVDNRVL